MEVKIKQQVRKANIYGSCLSLDSFFLRSVLFPNPRELGVQAKQLGGKGTGRSFSWPSGSITTYGKDSGILSKSRASIGGKGWEGAGTKPWRIFCQQGWIERKPFFNVVFRELIAMVPQPSTRQRQRALVKACPRAFAYRKILAFFFLSTKTIQTTAK